MSGFKRASKAQAKGRVGFAGPSGSGKTFTAMEWATVLAEGKPFAVIDTERGSGSLYADRFTFDTLDLRPPYHPERLIEALRDAESAGYGVVMVDSLSHFWNGPGGVLEIVDAAKSRFGGNSHSAWQVGTPLQQRMIDALIGYPGHVIITMRSKTEWVLQDNGRGKQAPVKVGLAPQQRDGVEYEFTLMLDVDPEHRSMVGKTRHSGMADRVFGPSDAAAAAEEFLRWLREGAQEQARDLTPGQRAALMDRLADLTPDQTAELQAQWRERKLPPPAKVGPADYDAALALIDAAGASDGTGAPADANGVPAGAQ